MEKDKIEQDVILATRAGLSYGQWKALHYAPAPVTRSKKAKSDDTIIPVKRCAICKAIIPNESQKQSNCGRPECIAERKRRQRRELYIKRIRGE